MPAGYTGEPFNVKPQKKMESAYVRVNGEEPNFTNHARIKDDDPFIDTLDYIFVTDDVEVVDVLELARIATTSRVRSRRRQSRVITSCSQRLFASSRGPFTNFHP